MSLYRYRTFKHQQIPLNNEGVNPSTLMIQLLSLETSLKDHHIRL